MAIGEYIPERAKKALAYAKLGISVLPLHGVNERGCGCNNLDCSSPGKHPATKNGLSDASTDEHTVTEWFKRPGLLNIGGRTGEFFWVLDVDADKGGLESLARLEAEHGPLDAAWVCHTGGGGRHYYFLGVGPKNSTSKLAPGLDVRGTGGYVVLPPSDHSSGQKYRWDKERRPFYKELTPAPAWLFDAVMALQAVPASVPVPERKGKTLERVKGAPEGQRNDTIFRLASSLRGQGVELAEALEMCRYSAANCSPPLPQNECDNIVRGVYERYPEGGRAIAVPERRLQDEPGAESRSFPLTDAGNAERLLYRLDGNVRYCHAFQKWLIWDGVIWRVDETGGAVLIQEALRMVRDLAEMGDGEYERKVVLKWAKDCEARSRLANMIELAKAFASIAPEDLDRDPMLLGVANGTLDLETGTLRDARKEDYITMQSPVRYDPDADCPEFEKFYFWAMSPGGVEDEELAGYVHMALGYSLTGLTTEQCLFFAHGSGANGKSTLLDVLKYILGDYAKTIPSDELMAQGFGGSFEATLARIKGARAVFCSETSNKTMNETTVKELASGEVMQARMKYGHPFEFRPTCKLWVAGNHKPRIAGNDWGIWRRIRLIPFENTISEAGRDPRLLEKLTAEAPGILAWLVAGLQVMLDPELGRRLPKCPRVMASTEEYREEMDVLGQFIEEVCEVGDGKTIQAGKLYGHYQQWAKACGQGALSMVTFANRLKDRGFEKVKSRDCNEWMGIGANDDTICGEHWWQKR